MTIDQKAGLWVGFSILCCLALIVWQLSRP